MKKKPPDQTGLMFGLPPLKAIPERLTQQANGGPQHIEVGIIPLKQTKQEHTKNNYPSCFQLARYDNDVRISEPPNSKKPPLQTEVRSRGNVFNMFKATKQQFASIEARSEQNPRVVQT